MHAQPAESQQRADGGHLQLEGDGTLGDGETSAGEFSDDLQGKGDLRREDELGEVKDREEQHQVDADEEHGASALDDRVAERVEEGGRRGWGAARPDGGLAGEQQQDQHAEDLNAIERPADRGRAV